MNSNIKDIRKITNTEYIAQYKHKTYGWIPYTVFTDLEEDGIHSEIVEEIKKMNSSDIKIDIEVLKSRFEGDMNTRLTNIISDLEIKYSKKEINSWSLKRIEAEKVLTGGSSQILTAESEISGEDISILASKIVEKSDAYNSKISIAAELKKKYSTLIQSSKSEKDLNAVENDFEKALKKYFGETNA